MAKAGKPHRYSESKGISSELQRLRHDEFGIKEDQQAAPGLLGPFAIDQAQPISPLTAHMYK
ncbi:hypothetical protein [Oryza sativa Japonica Group]|uniref:Uncharacterized protein n=1 Tax=Oryza sativa subsp. japonica TaxID=39947 RepID=Q5ZCU6_ORYSJ|nr:hypothetical protein [Oryza sativa Japonica Group]